MTIQKIISKKGGEKITMLTCYDSLTAKILEKAGVDMILVGDSLGTTFMGLPNTLGVTVEDIVHHTKAVRRGAPNSFIVADMPFASYGTTLEEGVKTGVRLIKECGANAVKLEGGVEVAETIKRLTSIGIPVMGHIGLKPQSINTDGYRIKGKTDEDTYKLINDGKILEEAGAFAFVIEGTTDEAAKIITESVNIPTIGIGAGCNTDGQVLVITDMLGYDKDLELKHNKKFAHLYDIIFDAVDKYIKDVKDKKFPEEANTFHRKG